MEKKYFYRMPKRKKFAYICTKTIVYLAIITASILGVIFSGVKLTTPIQKIGLSLGTILAVSIAFLVIVGKSKALFKNKSVALFVAFLFAVMFQQIGGILVMILGMILIPVAIDEFIIEVIWSNYIYNHISENIVEVKNGK